MSEPGHDLQGLPDPPRYFPIESGTYTVAPGLRPLGVDFGNGPADRCVFQFDRLFARYRENRMRCRAERLAKYLGTAELDPDTTTHVSRFISDRLLTEHPSWFGSAAGADGSTVLECRLTGEHLSFEPDMSLSRVEVVGEGGPAPSYVSAFDALCSQVQEDVAVMRLGQNGENWLAAVHLCSPSHWSAEAKLGKSFAAIHAPVPGIEKVNRAEGPLMDAMVRRGPYVRFVWSIAFDERLNHHPEPPPGVALDEWRPRGPRWDAPGPPFWLRVERQVLWGLPAVDAALFAIRVSHIDAREIRSDPRERALLRSGLQSMSPDSRDYKGISGCFRELLDWLDA